MFDVGLSELVLVALLALIVLGPKRLPEAARMVGRMLGKLRRFVTDVKQDFDQEMHNAELMELHKLKQEIDETRKLVQDASGKLMGQLGALPDDAAVAVQATSNNIAPPLALAETPRAKSKTKKGKKKSAAKSPHGRTRKTKSAKRG